MSTLLRAIYETPWAILPAKLAEILAVVHRHAAGETVAPEILAEFKAAAEARAAQSRAAAGGGVAVLPLLGSIFPRANMLTEYSGGTAATAFAATFRQALADPAVGSIVIDVDSPGGTVQGVDELASEIYQARGQKPVVAVANHLAASAAYWIATAADELLVTPSGEAGSIGVFAAHEDMSAALAQAGAKVTLISAGKYKTEGNPYEPLTEEARAAIQARVDEYYGMFVKAVARQRGVSAADVRGGFGEGRVVGAKEAVALGMADGVGTLDDAVARASRLASRGGGGTGRSASADRELRARRMRFTESQSASGAVAPVDPFR